MRKAYLRGREAEFLVATPMEQMLELPIAEARAHPHILPPLQAHPGGILTGNRSETGIGRGPVASPP